MNIIQGFPTPQKDYYKVYVQSCTFNQAPYIEDTLNGVAMQETNFPFVHHVIDDASTDGEQDVIKAWMDKNCDMEYAEYYDNNLCTITFAKNKKNPNCTLAIYLLKKNMFRDPKKNELFNPWREVCKYETLCEGDDYWIDPQKLQKQVEYMESHPECSYLFTDRYIDHETRGIRDEIRYRKDKYTTHDILSGFIPGLQTVMYRRELLRNPLLKTKGINGDRLYAYTASTMGEVHCLHEITAVYRNTGKGVSTSVAPDVFFNHVVSDMMRFHRNLNAHDWVAYCKGQSHNLGTYGAGLPKYKRILGVYNAFRKVDANINILTFLIIVLIYVKNDILAKIEMINPGIQSIKI